jgi:hypothetical protein
MKFCFNNVGSMNQTKPVWSIISIISDVVKIRIFERDCKLSICVKSVLRNLNISDESFDDVHNIDKDSVWSITVI